MTTWTSTLRIICDLNPAYYSLRVRNDRIAWWDWFLSHFYPALLLSSPFWFHWHTQARVLLHCSTEEPNIVQPISSPDLYNTTPFFATFRDIFYLSHQLSIFQRTSYRACGDSERIKILSEYRRPGIITSPIGMSLSSSNMSLTYRSKSFAGYQQPFRIKGRIGTALTAQYQSYRIFVYCLKQLQ